MFAQVTAKTAGVFFSETECRYVNDLVVAVTHEGPLTTL